MEKLETNLKLLPLGALFIIFCSALKLNVYYDRFNIQIGDYLKITEYPTLFIDDGLYYILSFGFSLVLNFGLLYLTRKSYDSQPNRLLQILIGVLTLVFVILMLVFNSLHTSDLEAHRSFKTYEFIIPVLLYFFITVSGKRINILIPLSIIIFLHMYSDGVISAEIIKENRNKLEYIIELDRDEIRTNDYLKYLGKSESEFFFYDLNLKESIIVPVKNYSKITVKKKPKINENN